MTTRPELDTAEVAAALQEAFTPKDLDRRVMDPLGAPAAVRSASRSVEQRVQALIEWAQQANRIRDLLVIAYDANHYNLKLKQVVRKAGIELFSGDSLDVLRPVLPNGEAEWLRGLAEVQRQVCRIELVTSIPMTRAMKQRLFANQGRNWHRFEEAAKVQLILDDGPDFVLVARATRKQREIAKAALERLKQADEVDANGIERAVESAASWFDGRDYPGETAWAGTGFLVGPDQVMTHRDLVGGAASEVARAGQLRVTFDDDRIPQHTAAVGTPDAYRSEELVFESSSAIVFRIDRDAGRTIAQQAQAVGTAARGRGWIVAHPVTPAPGTPVVITQFPYGQRQTITAEIDGLVDRTADTLYYRTAAALGALGAPCFDASWQLIGMHIGFSAEHQRNEGVPVQMLLRDVEVMGFAWTTSGGIVPTTGAKPRGVGDSRPVESSLDDVISAIDVSRSTEDPDDDAWEDEQALEVAAEQRWAWAEAAAVVAYFDPDKLTPIGAGSAEARVALLRESQPVRAADGSARWIVSDRVRTRALARLAKRGTLQKARAASAADPGEPLDVLLGGFLAGTPPRLADMKEPARLRALLQVIEWIDGAVATPSREEVRAALERATLLEPFRHLTQGYFAGREPELARLAAYVDVPDHAGTRVPLPLFVQGPGGMGKSALLAHFVLRNSERDPANASSWRPFAYLDFDRPELDAGDPVGVLLAIARQLGPQVPAASTEATKLVEKWTAIRRESQRNRAQRRSNDVREERTNVTPVLSDVAALIASVHAAMPAPILVVLDTLEEVQYANPDTVAPLVDLVAKLRGKAPALRPVLAGRVEITGGIVDPVVLQPLPQQAAEALLANHLPAPLAAKPDLIARMVNVVGGNPLSLRLAAECLAREPEVEKLFASMEDELWKKVGDALVQGRLYERILGHIKDKQVRAVAYPGILLRELTWQLIRDVLAKPCKLELADDAAARTLFDKLARETALVQQAKNRTDRVELRPELRRIVLEDLPTDVATQELQREIRERAVAFFETGKDVTDRAEELYHRLWLDQDPQLLDARWIRGLDSELRAALDERLPDRARAFLASKIGIVPDVQLMNEAPQESWEEWAEKRVRDLIRVGAYGRALDVLALRSQRSTVSRLHVLESIVKRSLPKPDLDGAAAAADRGLAAARASGDASQLHEALEEHVQVSRLRDDTVAAIKSLAALANLGDTLGDDLVVLQAQVEGLESMAPRAELLSDTAIRVFGRMPDELIARAPELARRVAAQVGGDDPPTLQRVIRLVGTGSLSQDAAAGLEHVLQGWQARTPEIAPFLPAQASNPREVASAVQYLVANRTLDVRTAGELAGWLRDVVVPRR